MQKDTFGFVRDLFKVAFPIILQNFLTSFINMLDTLMVGRLGTVDIAAVGLGNQIFFILNLMIFGAVSGGSIFISQYWGKMDLEGIHRTTGIMMSIAFAVSVVFAAVSFIFPEILLGLYTEDFQVIQKGAQYLKAVSLSFVFFGISFAFGNVERSTERVKLPAVGTIVSVCINALLNYILIFGIRIGGHQVVKAYGIVGAAWATVFSRGIEAFIIIFFAYAKKYECAGNLRQFFRKEKGFVPRYVKICIPVFLNEMLWGTGISMQNSIFSHAGTFEIAAFNITTTVSNLLYPICLGCGTATAIIIGKTIGQGQLELSRKLSAKLCVFISLLAFVLGLILIPLTRVLPFAFRVEEQVIRMATVFIIMKGLFYAFDAFNMVSVVGVFRSGGDTLFAMLMDVAFMWTVAIPLGWLGVKVWHLPYWGVYLCLLTEPFVKCALGIWRLRSGKWLKTVVV